METEHVNKTLKAVEAGLQEANMAVIMLTAQKDKLEEILQMLADQNNDQ